MKMNDCNKIHKTIEYIVHTGLILYLIYLMVIKTKKYIIIGTSQSVNNVISRLKTNNAFLVHKILFFFIVNTQFRIQVHIYINPIYFDSTIWNVRNHEYFEWI